MTEPLIKLLRRPLICVAGFSLVVNLLLLAPALFMLQLFDRVMVSHSRETLLVLLLGMAVALTLMLALDYLRARLQGVVGNVVAEALSPAVAQLTMARMASGGAATGPEGLRDVAMLRNLLSAQGLIAVFDAPWILVFLAVIWMAHSWLGVAALASAVIMVALAVANDRLTRRGIDAVQQATARASRYLEASLQNAEAVESLGMAPALVRRWRQLSAQGEDVQQPTARRSVAMAALTRMTRQAVQVLVQALGAYLVIAGESTPGVLVASTILLGRALAPVEQIVGSWRVLAEGRLALARLTRLFEGLSAQAPKMTLPPPAGRLTAQGLIYRPPGNDRLILAGVSLALEAGESLAVVGPGGAGKSTLLRLLMGIWTPTSGSVRLDGVDVSQWPRVELGPWIGYVPQDVELFAGTVAENIARLGEVDGQKVTAAAQRAGVHEMILGLPQGYDTPIEPGSTVVSPGQRQRIALARALFGDPRLLVLDEPNSNLDGAAEQVLAETLQRLRGQVTVVVVTHRTALVSHADKMLVLDGGRAVHYGATADVQRALQTAGPRAGTPQVVPMVRSMGREGGAG